MSANSTIRDLIDGLIACDEQPSDERLMEVRKTLEQRVMKMNRKGRISLYIFFAGIAAMVLAIAAILASGDVDQRIMWLAQTGIITSYAGTILIVIGAIGLLRFRGFGYVWARHDLHDTAIMELSLQVQRLSQRIDTLDKTISPAP